MRRLIVSLWLCLWVIAPMGTAQQVYKLHFGHFLEGIGWDPVKQSEPATLVFYDVIYDTLVTMDFAGRIEPRLATDWEYVDDDRLVLVMQLRDDVVFSDGTPFNADVAKQNIERAKEEGSPLVREELATISTVDALDEYTLQITLLRHDDFLLPHFTGFSGMIASPAAFETLNKIPIGSGPYQLNTDSSTDDHFFYERFHDHWHDDLTETDFIEMVIRDPATLVNDFFAGTLDLIQVPPEFAGDFTDNPTVNVLTVDSNLYLLAFLDRRGELIPELGNQEVRCAISQAIDRAEYTKQFGGNVLEPMTVIPPASWYGFAPDAIAQPFDLEIAQDRLIASGIEGKPKLTITVPASQADNLAFVVDNLSQLGVTVNMVPIEDSEFRSETFNREYPATLITVEPSHFVLFVQQYVLSSGRFNPFNVLNTEIEEIVQEIRNVPLAESEPGWQAVSRVLNEACYFVPLSFGSLVVAAAPYVRGAQVRFRIDGFVDFRQMFIDPELLEERPR